MLRSAKWWSITLSMLYLGHRVTDGVETCHTLRAKAKVTLRAMGTNHFPSLRARNDSVNCNDFEFLSLFWKVRSHFAEPRTMKVSISAWNQI